MAPDPNQGTQWAANPWLFFTQNSETEAEAETSPQTEFFFFFFFFGF